MKLFDPQAAQNLLNSALDANDTKAAPLPVGETIAQICEAPEIKTGVSGSGSKNPGTPWARLNVKLKITDKEYLSQSDAFADRDEAYITHGIMLEMADGRIAAGPGKNVRLGKFREAAGVNGKPLADLQGQYVRVMIAQKPHHAEPDVTVAEVAAVSKVD